MSKSTKRKSQDADAMGEEESINDTSTTTTKRQKRVLKQPTLSAYFSPPMTASPPPADPGEQAALEQARIMISTSPTLTPFRKQVLTLLTYVPRGQWTTYQAMSNHISATAHKTCARAIGNAMRNNPYAPAVPCHRVLASDGSIGGFCGSWGEEGTHVAKKKKLLAEEGVRFDGKGKALNRAFTSFSL